MTTAAQDQFAKSLILGLKLIIGIDGSADRAESRLLQEVAEGLTGRRLDQQTILAEVSTPVDFDSSLKELLAGSNVLSAEQRELIMRGALVMAAADGAIQEGEMRLVLRLAEALRVEPERLPELLEDEFGPSIV